MNKIDKDALTRAMTIARREAGRSAQLDSMLEDSPWREVAEFAAYCVQGRALRLKPWESPPSSCDEDGEGDRQREGRALLRRMLAAGLSRFEPDPLRALGE